MPVLILAPAEQIAQRHGAEFYGWELRGGKPICVEAFPEDEAGFGFPAPDGIRYVITIGGKTEPPFTGLTEVERRDRVALWEVSGVRLRQGARHPDRPGAAGQLRPRPARAGVGGPGQGPSAGAEGPLSNSPSRSAGKIE